MSSPVYCRVGSIRHNHTYYRRECGCGKVTLVTKSYLSSKCRQCHTKRMHAANTKHGHAPDDKRGLTGAYRSWGAMRQRCNNPNVQYYHLYGGRGISVCARWDKYENFYADMGDRPEGRSIDRIDVNGNYEPSNCRWASPKEQTNNRRVA